MAGQEDVAGRQHPSTPELYEGSRLAHFDRLFGPCASIGSSSRRPNPLAVSRPGLGRPGRQPREGSRKAKIFCREMVQQPKSTVSLLPPTPNWGLIGRDSVPTGRFTNLGLFPN